jgi:hypothetical protein
VLLEGLTLRVKWRLRTGHSRLKANGRRGEEDFAEKTSTFASGIGEQFATGGFTAPIASKPGAAHSDERVSDGLLRPFELHLRLRRASHYTAASY